MAEDLPPLLHLDYPIDMDLLLRDARGAKAIARGFNELRPGQQSRTAQDYFKIGYWDSPYIRKIMNDLGVNGKPRFYFQEPGSFLDWHTDINTLCSVNMVLSDDPAPISFRSGEMYYRQALLNTTVPHAVKNGPTERILFKISIFDKTFEQVAETIGYRR
jgi:hypothetical protein